MIRIRHVSLLFLVMLFMFMIGCISAEGVAPDIPKMSPKQKVTMMYGTYNSQYNLYMMNTGFALDSTGKFVQTSFPVLDEDQVNILREKRKILSKVYPLIGLYGAMVSRGEPTSTDIEQKIFLALDALKVIK